MPRPDLISQEYITPASVTNACLYDGRTRTELDYSDLRPKPLSSRRRRFIGTNVCFIVLHLCATLILVLCLTMQRQPQRHASASHGCELCDLWCTWNCSQLMRNGDEGLKTQMVVDINETHSGTERKGRCCVKGREALSTNYEYFQNQKSISGGKDFPRKKIFKGIRLKDKWIEDIHWSKYSQSVLRFEKNQKSGKFVITADGTFSVHSRIDFTCLNENSFTIQKLSIDSRFSNQSHFLDEKAHLGQSQSTWNGTFVYTSTINIMVKLQFGDILKILTVPDACASPRTIVVFQSKREGL